MNITPADTSQDPIAKALRYQTIYEGKEYNHLPDAWKERKDNAKRDYIPIRTRRPNVRLKLGKKICTTVSDFLMSSATFPALTSDRDDLTAVVSWLRDNLLIKEIPGACTKACVQGSVGITFGFVRGKLILRTFPRAQAWPVFDDADELLGLVVRYLATDPSTGRAAWWRMTLDAKQEVWEKAEAALGSTIPPTENWQRVSANDHGFGFVPAVWVRHLDRQHGDPEGLSLLDDLDELLREVDYARSRQNRSLTYTADPQMVIQDTEPSKTKDTLVKSPAGTIVLGKDGKAYFVEINGKGIELQAEFAKDLRREVLELARVVINDPEHLDGTAMSGFALRILFEPQIKLCDRLKQDWEPAIVELTNKILLGGKAALAKGAIRIPGFAEAVSRIAAPAEETETKSVAHPWLNGGAREWPIPAYVSGAVPVSLSWGAYFDASPGEEQTVMATAAAGSAAGIISEEAAVRMASRITGESAETELVKIAAGRPEVVPIEKAPNAF
ncbi:MAG TPA: hypothetical protein VK181_02440 [Rhizobium sp.]|nr:hypothetical protein [Rhizobium sp.]